MSTTYTASQAGNWNSSSTWGGAGVPTNNGDIANVNGFAVVLNVNIGASFTVEDLSSGGAGSLVVSSSQSISAVTLTLKCVLNIVSGGILTLTGSGYLFCWAGSTLNINGGSLIMNSSTANFSTVNVTNGGSFNVGALASNPNIQAATFSAASGTSVTISSNFNIESSAVMLIYPGCSYTVTGSITVYSGCTLLVGYNNFAPTNTATRLDDVSIPAVQGASLSIPITPRTYAGAPASPTAITVVPYRNGTLDTSAMGGWMPSAAGAATLLANYSGDTALNSGDQLDLYVEVTIAGSISSRWYHAEYSATAMLGSGKVASVTSPTIFALTLLNGQLPAAGQWIEINVAGTVAQAQVLGIAAGVVTVAAPVSGVATGDGWAMPSWGTQAQSAAVNSAIASLSGGSITLVSPVTNTGDIAITQWDDYLLANNRQIAFSNSAGTWAGGTINSCTLTISAGGVTIIPTITGTIVSASGSQSIYFQIPSAQTGLLTQTGRAYIYQVLILNATGLRETDITGAVVVSASNNP